MIERVENSPKILMVNSNRGLVGGVEKLMLQMALMLRRENWEVYGLFEHTAFEDKSFDEAFDDYDLVKDNNINDIISDYIEIGLNVVCIHKTDKWQWVKTLKKHFPTVVIVHDHDFYCLRRHKYFPFKRTNCYLPFSKIYCPLCAGLIEKKNGEIKLIDIEQRYLLFKQIRECRYSFVLSDYMKDNLIMNGWAEDRIRTLIPFQQTHPQNSSPNEVPLILYVGQLIRGKGVDLLIKALSLVDKNFKCIILGRGNDESYLREMIKSRLLEDKIELYGWTENVSAMYDKADIIVVPSRWQEPFGLVGLEAFAHHKPVIGFGIGGISQWLKHKVNGIIVKPGDYRRLAIAIKGLINDPIAQKEMGQAGFEMVKNQYTYEEFKQSILKPLLDLIDKHAQQT